MPHKNIRPNVLTLPHGIRHESIQKAHDVVQAFQKHLHDLGSVRKAAAKTAAETGARVETKAAKASTKKDDK